MTEAAISLIGAAIFALLIVLIVYAVWAGVLRRFY